MDSISSISRPMNHLLLLSISSFSYYSTLSKCLKPRKQNVEALRILDLIIPLSKPIKSQSQGCSNHLRLIEACIQDFVVEQEVKEGKVILKTNLTTPNVFDEISDRNVCWGSLFFQMHKQGMKVEATTLSCALSSCCTFRNLECGMQLHCLGIKTGFYSYVYVGSSLISLYGKCGNLEDAYKVFEEMPVRNVVSWTAMIAGFAQHWKVDMCLELYHRMRCSTSKPNDFTFTTLLSACTESGALGQGKSAHCQIIQMGFYSYVHIGNALISMYSKCGNVVEALYIFATMKQKDLVTWNSMIAGYAQHGLADLALNMLKEMEKVEIKPDAITFLAVLSSCRHAGLVELGQLCFKSMVQHGVEPDLDHYSCIVDLLGRAGLVGEAKQFIDKMPISPNAVIWGSLLSSCRLHGKVQIGIEAAENRLLLVPHCVATHIQLVNLYANVGCWEQVAKVRKMMKDRGLKTNPGFSWIEIKNEVYRFRAEDRSNTRVGEILAVVDSLADNMIHFGYVPKIHEESLDI
ncbi:hypothetical protein AQUCO_04200169v1 [Aquilegia coerulea]|uniref:DYW domain-containing protein n=1 Tax=Aquilegia coerulea TaxID=218851 RepID=A0A2G5CPN9_AQUCA|nr:hypothetical protein AQUCO_04200169v1 [Aquilegia coerulea]